MQKKKERLGHLLRNNLQLSGTVLSTSPSLI